jgi:hypothetical protein
MYINIYGKQAFILKGLPSLPPGSLPWPPVKKR